MKKVILTTILAVCITALSFGQSSVMDFYNAKIQSLKEEAKIDPRASFELKIIKKNVQNGYLKYDYNPAQGYLAGVVSSPEEMVYFTSKNGKKFIATALTMKLNKDGKGNTDLLNFHFYEFADGKLVDKTKQYFTSSLKEQVEATVKKKRTQMGNASMYIALPEFGTTIKIGLWLAHQGGMAKVDICELQYNVNNGTFTFVAK